jgi:hypothetical protein
VAVEMAVETMRQQQQEHLERPILAVVEGGLLALLKRLVRVVLE